MKPLDIILTDAAPVPMSGYSQALRYGETLVTSSFVGSNPNGAGIVAGGFEAELRQALHYVQEVLAAAGCTLHDVVRVNVALTDIAKAAELDRVCHEYFHSPYPTRTLSGVKELWGGAQVAIDVWAIVRNTH
jgi:2-iminobutanoate/2-iminopropanoate deaminase